MDRGGDDERTVGTCTSSFAGNSSVDAMTSVGSSSEGGSTSASISISHDSCTVISSARACSTATFCACSVSIFKLADTGGTAGADEGVIVSDGDVWTLAVESCEGSV